LPDLAVAVIYPELLGLYADRGNALGFRYRARLRGLDTEIVNVPPGAAIPSTADLYILGGAEDTSMPAALALLRKQAGLGRAVDRGASMLGVCAGLQILGHSFLGRDGEVVPGLGLLPVTCRRLPGSRAVGEIAVTSTLLGELQGFENHRGDARLDADASPLGVVTHGVGSGHDHVEGVIEGNLIGTYLHGPVLVRNPAMADFFLGKAMGGALPEVRDDLIEQYRAERRAQMRHLRHRR
jgi:lipid II isoglutaminyl synthase (glutamine-hydrolysing)